MCMKLQNLIRVVAAPFISLFKHFRWQGIFLQTFVPSKHLLEEGGGRPQLLTKAPLKINVFLPFLGGWLGGGGGRTLLKGFLVAPSLHGSRQPRFMDYFDKGSSVSQSLLK